MKFALSDFTAGIEMIMRDPNLYTCTVFCSPLSKVTQRVRITRVGKGSKSLVINYGKPNYAEREFLKLCKKAKTNPRRFLLKSFPKKKA